MPSPCRWDRETKRHLTREHREDCKSNLCNGCLPCTHDEHGNPVRHCRARIRCTAHLGWGEHTCAGDLGKIRTNLTRILTALALMPEEAEERGINSSAAGYAGPSAHPGSAYTRRRYNATHGRPFEDPDQYDPWQMLGERERWIREDLGHADRLLVSPTLAETCGYLSWVLTDLARDETQADIVHDLLSETARLASHLEEVLHDGRQPERGAPCRSCPKPAPQLELRPGHWCNEPGCTREHFGDDSGDRWVCPDHPREHWWTAEDYRRWVYADARDDTIRAGA